MKKIIYMIFVMAIILMLSSCDKEEMTFVKYEYIYVDDEINLNITEDIVNIFSLDEEIVSVTKEGVIKGHKKGTTYIKVELKNNIQKEFQITVLQRETTNNDSVEEKDEIIQILELFHNDEIYIKTNLKIGSGTPNYYKDIYGSVSKVLYEDLVINKTYLEKGNNAKGHGSKMNNIDFITVHYTGNMDKGANAKKHAIYFTNSSTTSIHYTVGNDGIYQTLDENIIAYHAGASSNMTWHKSGVKYDGSNKPTFGISKKGYFTINDIETIIKVPYETKKGYGYVTNSRWLNKSGLAYQIINNEYYLGGARWIYTQIAEGRICSTGGNNNSIGIETCVDDGSDLWYTWQKTAKLVASLMIKYNLDISRVVPHHFFSAKNCPQPMLENDLEIWNEFIKLVEAEYIYQTKLKDIKIIFISNETNILNSVGRITTYKKDSKITYALLYKNNKITFTSFLK